MGERIYSREVTEPVYEAGKQQRVLPDRLERLGLYTMRLMFPPRSHPFAIETPALIQSAKQLEEDKWRIDFIHYSLDDTGATEDGVAHFTNDGHMFMSRQESSGLESRTNMGYFLETIIDVPRLDDLVVNIEIPDDISGLEIVQQRVLVDA